MRWEYVGRFGAAMILFGIIGVIWAWDKNQGTIALLSIVGVVLGLGLFIIAGMVNQYLDQAEQDSGSEG